MPKEGVVSPGGMNKLQEDISTLNEQIGNKQGKMVLYNYTGTTDNSGMITFTAFPVSKLPVYVLPKRNVEAYKYHGCIVGVYGADTVIKVLDLRTMTPFANQEIELLIFYFDYSS